MSKIQEQRWLQYASHVVAKVPPMVCPICHGEGVNWAQPECRGCDGMGSVVPTVERWPFMAVAGGRKALEEIDAHLRKHISNGQA